MHMNLVWVPDVQSCFCGMSLPKYPAHNPVFDNKYLKVLDTRLNAIHAFGLRIKQFSAASNIEFSDILETPLCFTTLVY